MTDNECVEVALRVAIEKAEQYVAGILGYSPEKKKEREFSLSLINSGIYRSRFTQTFGMSRPIPIDSIYQHSRLCSQPPRDKYPRELFNSELPPSRKEQKVARDILIAQLLQKSENLVILGEPGAGKSVLLKWLFLTLLADRPKTLTMLIVLREQGSLENLGRFVHYCENANQRSLTKTLSRILLVDGYDEISKHDRSVCAQFLRRFAGLNIGPFILTCRDHYEIDEIHASRYWLDRFNKMESLGFTRAFFNVQRDQTDPEEMLRMLYERNLETFCEHPLLLALTCFLQTRARGVIPEQPRDLLDRALVTLTSSWDAERYISRTEEGDKTDSFTRESFLRFLAYRMERREETDGFVMNVLSEFYKTQSVEIKDLRKFLLSISQWYGIVVPVGNGSWTFSHAIIHDFLAAKYWRDIGFSSEKVKIWNERSAMAMCLLHDCTMKLVEALRKDCPPNIFARCLQYQASFNFGRIATEYIQYMNRKNAILDARKDRFNIVLKMQPDYDVFRYASDRFLNTVAFLGISHGIPRDVGLTAAIYAVCELWQRKGKVDPNLVSQLRQKFDTSQSFIVGRGDVTVSFDLEHLFNMD